MRCCPPRFEVHSEVTHRHVVDKRIRKSHFESFRGTLTVLVNADSSQLTEIRMVEAGLQHVEAVGLGPIGRKAEGFVVVQGGAMETIQGGEAVGVQTAHLCRAAHCGYGVAQS